MKETPTMSGMAEIRAELPAATWRSTGAGGGSVEVAMLSAGYVALRDASRPDAEVLVFTPGEWDAFLAGVRDGEFELPK